MNGQDYLYAERRDFATEENPLPATAKWAVPVCVVGTQCAFAHRLLEVRSFLE